MTREQFLTFLEEHAQDHLTTHFRSLAPEKQEELLRCIDGLDLHLPLRLHSEKGNAENEASCLQAISVPSIITIPGTKEEISLQNKARILGESLIRNNKVAVLIVAGGQGSRLDHPGPKGTFSLSPVKNKTLFQIFAESLRAISLRYNASIPLLIMTSRENHGDTVQFFEEHDHFGLAPASVEFFQQDVIPSITPDGKLILKEETGLFVNPDGHGGSLKALSSSGILDSLLEKDYSQLCYCQVDNPLVKLADPVFLGYHTMARAQCSTKVVRRRDVGEKVGVYVKAGDRDAIIEYSDLGEDYMSALDSRGNILYWAGNTAIHIFDLAFIKKINEHGFALPYHCATKTLECLGEDRRPAQTTGWKFETFVFDTIPLAEKTCCMEVLREEEFAPVKNKEGSDSPDTARQAMSSLFRAWLLEAGFTILPDALVEVNPLYALDKEEFLRKTKGGGITLTGNICIG